ncbi:MAG: efflux RND transporter periplasmic adaptor subunit [bacterium]
MNEKEARDLEILRIDPDLREDTHQYKGWVFSVIVALIIGISFLVVYWRKRMPLKVEVIVARSTMSGQNRVILTASGYVEARRKATIASKITGRIKELYFEEGMKVHQDQILTQLDDSEARAQIESAVAKYKVTKAAIQEIKTSLKYALKTFKRYSMLREKNAISQAMLDKSETIVENLRAQLTRAEEEMVLSEAGIAVAKRHADNYIIKAPFAGIVVSKDAQVGEIISPVSAGDGFTRTGISTIVDMNSLEIEVDVNESYISKVRIGQRVVATLDAYPDWRIPANVRAIIPSANRQKATVKVWIAFEKLDPKILPEMGVKVSFLNENQITNNRPAVLVTEKAVFEAGEKKYVYIYRNGIAEKRAVLIGKTFESHVEILAGLSDGERIIVKWEGDIHEGHRVKIDPSA